MNSSGENRDDPNEVHAFVSGGRSLWFWDNKIKRIHWYQPKLPGVDRVYVGLAAVQHTVVQLAIESI